MNYFIYRYALSLALPLMIFFGAYFILARTPDKAIYDNYIRSRRIMGVALLLLALLWLCRNKWQSAAVLALAAVWMYPPVSDIGQTLGALLAPALVLCYSGQRGRDDHRLFYWAYPAHLTVLWAISAWLGYPI